MGKHVFSFVMGVFCSSVLIQTINSCNNIQRLDTYEVVVNKTYKNPITEKHLAVLIDSVKTFSYVVNEQIDTVKPEITKSCIALSKIEVYLKQAKRSKQAKNLLYQRVSTIITKLPKFTEPKTSTDFIAQYKLKRIKRYVLICKARAKNKKYFYGWVKRTIEI